jgi:hypothetical protein
VAEIEIGERGVATECVAYDLNLASDILCRARRGHASRETVMTIQFSKQPIAVLSDGLPKIGSGLVRRLVCARDDPGKARIRMWLIDLDDAQLQSGLGLTVEDIAVLRTGTRTASPLR